MYESLLIKHSLVLFAPQFSFNLDELYDFVLRTMKLLPGLAVLRICLFCQILSEEKHIANGIPDKDNGLQKDCGCKETNRLDKTLQNDDTSESKPYEQQYIYPLNDEGKVNPYDEMVLVRGGLFIIGTDRPYIAADGESPSRNVNIEDFWIDEHEVSNAQFLRYVEETGYITEVSN